MPHAQVALVDRIEWLIVGHSGPWSLESRPAATDPLRSQDHPEMGHFRSPKRRSPMSVRTELSARIECPDSSNNVGKTAVADSLLAEHDTSYL